MKNKRNVIIAFILICCLCLSIGYAALTDTLTINGSADIVAANDNNPDDGSDTVEEVFDDKLGFVAVKLDAAAPGTVKVKNTTPAVESVTTTETTFDMCDEVTFDIDGFTTINEEVKITYTIKNLHPDLKAKITEKTAINTTLSTTYFSVTENWNETTVNANGDTATVTITVKVIKTPTEAQSGTINFVLNAEAVE